VFQLNAEITSKSKSSRIKPALLLLSVHVLCQMKPFGQRQCWPGITLQPFCCGTTILLKAFRRQYLPEARTEFLISRPCAPSIMDAIQTRQIFSPEHNRLLSGSG